jgi:hypothetical protein
MQKHVPLTFSYMTVFDYVILEIKSDKYQTTLEVSNQLSELQQYHYFAFVLSVCILLFCWRYHLCFFMYEDSLNKLLKFHQDH